MTELAALLTRFRETLEHEAAAFPDSYKRFEFTLTLGTLEQLVEVYEAVQRWYEFVEREGVTRPGELYLVAALEKAKSK